MRFNVGQVALVAAALGLGVAGNRFLRRLKAIDLTGKVVLITGGSRGLGLALAEEFAHQGARLVLCAPQIQKVLQYAQSEPCRNYSFGIQRSSAVRSEEHTSELQSQSNL